MKNAAKQKKNNRNNDNKTEVNVSDFIPYTCHFDKSTILTKNGELMQVIKVTGFKFESVKDKNSQIASLRETVREAISSNIKSNNFAIWVHTMRRQKDVSTGGVYPDNFANELNEAWCKKNDWEHKFVNELYITIIIEGQSLSIKDPTTFFRSMYFPAEFKHRMGSLEKSTKELTLVVDNILKCIDVYGAQKLQLKKIQGIYHSEILQFLGKIINLKENPIPVAMVDLSEALPTHKTSFGFDMIEVRGYGERSYSVILTVKEYHNISTEYMDWFLQLPIRYIITETFDFVNRNKALEHFKSQADIQEVIGDELLGNSSGLYDILGCDNGSQTDFGEHQINISIIANDVDSLNNSVKQAVDALQSLGVVIIREDVRMEDCYWAQLPANFEFIKRLTPINTKNIAGYASLYNFPAGKIENNYWGDALTVFNTSAGTPYFFNFHYGNNGHTSIIGPFGSGKTVLMNFLISQSMKYEPKLFFFDQNRSSELFLKSLNAKYKRIDFKKTANQIHFNPLKIDDNIQNRAFLEKWFEFLITSAKKPINTEDSQKIKDAITYSYSLPIEQRKLSNIAPKYWPLSEGLIVEDKDDGFGFSSAPSDLGETINASDEGKPSESDEKISLWYGVGKFASIFDNDEDDFVLYDHQLQAFDVTQVAKDSDATAAIIYYMYHCIYESLDGKPTIIVFDEAWRLLNFPEIASELKGWLTDLTNKNAIAIFSTENVSDIEKSSITKTLIDKIETKIFLPNSKAEDSYQDIFALSDNEFKGVKSISKYKREFVLKHNIDSIICTLNLEDLDFELSILSTKQETLAIMDGSIKDAGDDPEKWLPIYKKRLSA